MLEDKRPGLSIFLREASWHSKDNRAEQIFILRWLSRYEFNLCNGWGYDSSNLSLCLNASFLPLRIFPHDVGSDSRCQICFFFSLCPILIQFVDFNLRSFQMEWNSRNFNFQRYNWFLDNRTLLMYFNLNANCKLIQLKYHSYFVSWAQKGTFKLIAHD